MEKEIKDVYDVSAPESKSDAVRMTTIRSMTLFCTVFLTSLVLCGCVLGAVWIVQNGGDPSQCDDIIAGENTGIFDRDMTKETRLMMGDGRVLVEQFEYDHSTNTLLIHTPPSNFSGYSQATVALDYGRSLVFVNIHDDNICIALPWPAEMARNLQTFMEQEDSQTGGDVLDLLTRELTDMNFVNTGEIPAGYLKVTTGTTTGALCAGRPTYWLQDNTGTSSRKRRRVEDTIIIICWPECCIVIELEEPTVLTPL